MGDGELMTIRDEQQREIRQMKDEYLGQRHSRVHN